MQLLFSKSDSPLHEKKTNPEAMQFDFTPEDKSSITPPSDFKTTEEPMVVAMMADAALGTAESIEVEEVALKEASVAEEFEPSRSSDMNGNNQIMKQESNTVIRKSTQKKGPPKAKAVKAIPTHKEGVVKRPTGSNKLSKRKIFTMKDFVRVSQFRTTSYTAPVVKAPPKLEVHEPPSIYQARSDTIPEPSQGNLN